VQGNFNQKKYPVNPISYMGLHGHTDVFRFILTHPDMDHMDGIKAFFDAFQPTNFWDTDNDEEKEFGGGNDGGFCEDDWKFYKKLRDGKLENSPKRLALHSGARGQYYNQNDNNQGGGDGLHVLAPTKQLVAAACENEDYNDSSYVILYLTCGYKILFAGDSHDATWEHILNDHVKDVTDVDILVAPHHGRHSDRDWEFLDVVNPRLTFFGNAKSGHLAYSAWSNRKLPIITNNQAGTIVVDASEPQLDVYVTCEAYAKANANAKYYNTFYSENHKGYYWGSLLKKTI